MLAWHREAAIVSLVLLHASLASGQAQPLLQQSFSTYTVSLTAIDEPEAGGDFRFRIVWADGTTVPFSAHALSQPPSAARVSLAGFGDNRLLITGESSGPNTHLVLDPRTGQIIDTFLAIDSTISQDSRFVAFRKAVSRKDSANGAIYLVYDLAQSPAANRMDPLDSDPSDVGWVVYPPENRTAQSYKPLSDDADTFHSLSSPLAWVDDRHLCFVDYSNLSASAVLIALVSDAHQVTAATQLLDPLAILDPSLLDNQVPAASYIHADSIVKVPTSQGTLIRISMLAAHFLRMYSVDVMF